MLIGAVDRRLLASISAAIFRNDTRSVLADIKQVDEIGYHLRQFCQELIEHFRHLLIIRSVQKPEEILDLSQPELEELRLQAESVTAQDLQRRLTLLLKADGEMAFASFPRLALEMALLKAATLEPVVPILELLEKLKAMETSAVHTPALPWDAGRISPVAEQRHHEPLRTVPQPQRTAFAPPSSASAPQGAAGSAPSWERFVAYAYEKRPSVGSVLEHGSPLKQEAGLMEIGFPAGSYYLSSIQDADSIAEIKTLADEFTGQETIVRIKPIAQAMDDVPLSLAEKKKSDNEQRQEELKREVAEHPVIKEALRIFGGSITDIRED